MGIKYSSRALAKDRFGRMEISGRWCGWPRYVARSAFAMSALTCAFISQWVRIESLRLATRSARCDVRVLPISSSIVSDTLAINLARPFVLDTWGLGSIALVVRWSGIWVRRAPFDDARRHY